MNRRKKNKKQCIHYNGKLQNDNSKSYFHIQHINHKCYYISSKVRDNYL